MGWTPRSVMYIIGTATREGPRVSIVPWCVQGQHVAGRFSPFSLFSRLYSRTWGASDSLSLFLSSGDLLSFLIFDLEFWRRAMKNFGLVRRVLR
jgi:hypothetical protein